MTKEKLAGFEIKVRGVSKTFNDTKRDSHILDEISFDVKPSEILALCGLSGVGKSTNNISDKLKGHNECTENHCSLC